MNGSGHSNDNSSIEWSLDEQNESKLCALRTAFAGRGLIKKLSLRHVGDVREKRRKVIFCTDKHSNGDNPKYCFKYGLEEQYRNRLKKEPRAIKVLSPVPKQLSFRTLQIREVIKYADSPRDKVNWILFRDYGAVFPIKEGRLRSILV